MRSSTTATGPRRTLVPLRHRLQRHLLRIAEAVRALPVAMALPAHLTQAITAHGVLLDGEAIVFRPDRHSDFCGAENEQGRRSGVLRRL